MMNMLKRWLGSRKMLVALVGVVASVAGLLLWKYLPLEMSWKEVLSLINACMVPLYGWAGIEGMRDVMQTLMNAKQFDVQRLMGVMLKAQQQSEGTSQDLTKE